MSFTVFFGEDNFAANQSLPLMPGISETATVTLTVNGAQAKQMMSELETKIKDTEQHIKSLKAQMADPKDIEKAKKQLKNYQQQLENMKSSTEGVNRALGHLDTATPRQLEKALRTLNRQLKDMTPGTDVWKSHIDKIKELKERLSELHGELGEQESLWGKFKEWSTGAWPAIDLLRTWGGDFVDVMRNSVDAYASMDQEMANVRKFTGMTEEQVAALNEEFKKMDTRTSREDLNKLAQEAGRLGKNSVEDVLGFVRAADQINVALDDLGEGATLTLSKLTGIFGIEKTYGTEESLLKVGSVINELSQNCSASAPYLAEFASRMGGVGAQAGMTVQEIMGFGAVLDTTGINVEAASTALSQVLVRMMQDPAKYAKVAGLEVKKFSEMLKTDANGALILFLETLEKAGGMNVLAPMFKDMGENGSNASKALSTLATHIEEVKAQQEAANVAFAEGTSIGKEAAVQNSTVQAGLEKCKNAANELKVELGEHLAPVMGHILTSSSAIMKAMLNTINFLIAHKEAIITITVATAAYIAVLKLHSLWLNKVAVQTMLTDKWTKIWTVTQKALSGVWATMKLGVAAVTNAVQYFTNGLQVNYAMQQRWRNAMAGMKFATWTGLIMAVASAFVMLYNYMKKVREEEQIFTKIRSEAAAKVGEQRVAIDLLVAAAENEKLSLEERRKAIDKLNAIIPNYNAQLDETTGKYRANKVALDEYLKSLTRQYEVEGARTKLKELGKEKAEATLAIKEAEEYWNAVKDTGPAQGFTSTYGYVGHVGYDNRSIAKKNLEAAQRRRESAEAKEAKLLDSYGVDLQKDAVASEDNQPTILPPPPSPTPAPRSGGAKPDRFAAEKSWREQEEAMARIAYAKGETTFSEHNVRMAEIAEEYQQKLLNRTDLTGNERLKIEADYWESVGKEAEAGAKESLDVENRRYQKLVDSLKKNHLEKLKDESLSAEERQQENEAYQEALELAELRHLERIRDIYAEGSAERLDAQRKLQEKELAAQERHLKKMEELQQKMAQKYASMKDKYFGDNEQERNEKYNKDLEALKVVYDREIEAAGDNAAEKERIDKAYLEAQRALRLLYGKQSEEDSKFSLKKAVSDSVEWLNSDGGKAVTGTLSTLASGMSSVFSGLSSMIQAELQIQTAAIEARYDKEVEYAQGNSYKVAKLEKKKDAEIAKAKNESNRKMFAMQVIQAVAQTAQNAISAYGSAAAIPVVGHVLAPVAAAMAVAAGMIQIASIKKQQQAAEAQGYSQGGFTKRGAVDEPAGIVHAGEWVASQKLLASPVARPMIEALDYAQRTNTIGSLRADDVSRSIRANDSLVRMAEGDGSAALMVAAVARNAEVLRTLSDRLNEPFVTVNTVTGDHGIKQAQDEYSRLMNNKSPKSKRNGTADRR